MITYTSSSVEVKNLPAEVDKAERLFANSSGVIDEDKFAGDGKSSRGPDQRSEFGDSQM